MVSFIRIILITLLALSYNIHASDLAKEKRWADQVVDAIIDGDAVWLNDGKSDFLGIFTEAEEDKGRAVVVMHGTGIHPDWQQVVQPLRVGLIAHNWSTLSIQMPILANEAEYPEYAPLYDEVAPRIDAAIKYLKKNGIESIVLLGNRLSSSSKLTGGRSGRESPQAIRNNTVHQVRRRNDEEVAFIGWLLLRCWCYRQ